MLCLCGAAHSTLLSANHFQPASKRACHRLLPRLQGHNCTDYPRWFAAREAYGPIGWTKDYEPWFIADRTLMPFYDSVFRGYGWNKVTQVTNTHSKG